VNDGADIIVVYSPINISIDVYKRSITRTRNDKNLSASDRIYFIDIDQSRIDHYETLRIECIQASDPLLATWHATSYTTSRFVTMSADERFASWLEEGDNWARDGNLSDAARCFDRAAKMRPQDEQANWKSAVAHAGAGNKAAATAALAQFRKVATPDQQTAVAASITELEAKIAALP